MTTITKESLAKIIESADEVLTALAGTNEDVHRDDSKKMCDLWDELNDRYAPPKVVKEMARMLLAGMEQEPVAWTDADELRDVMNGGSGYLFAIGGDANKFADPRRQMMLYTNPQPLTDSERAELEQYRKAADQPVQVVPDEISTTDAMKALNGRVITMSVHTAYKLGWNACRAAMLQAGNSPVVPDGWIKCGEQMPDDRVSVVLWDAEVGEISSGHYSHKTETFYRCGEIIDSEITHWMLPAAPQQERSNG